ncbi:eCIS core domain-containing protein [Halovivax cerinus]|uniref:DUF4157 domain-containing protein n=1 Tax=Halovivax cerinus TaxID=1487865 RepID=A0ABD5NRM6_9EURY|nr:DUF4157 domain-containing protein [Halovivax cerinus]
MGRRKRRRRADRERAAERDQADGEDERAAASTSGTPLGVPDAPIPDSPIPDAGVPDVGAPDMGMGGAATPGAAMGQEHGRGATPSLSMRGYGPEAQQHIHRATTDAGTDPDAVPDAVLDVLATGSGQSLDASTQRALEERMDADFSDVEIHTGPEAAKAADAIDARAFTCGTAIVFNDGEYDPESAEGQHLLAHELAHVKQQTGGANGVRAAGSASGSEATREPGAAISMMPQVDADLEIDPDPQLEREADQMAQRVLNSETLGLENIQNTSIHIQRSEKQTQTDDGSDDAPVDVTFSDTQLQSKFKHAPVFGVEENWNMDSKERFKSALKEHISDAETRIIEGKYQDQPAIHYYNSQTKNVVITKPDRRFWTCWKLSPAQENYLLNTGKIGGR